ncbi:MAG: DNA recombination protein RmuC [Bacteroidales bacterium]|nr:DNA recombination protein RmuC [Bacteroidales bacterium]MCM1148284.1 DNA recombination protein RmuC [Bacteroidales bacterium]MCM1206488.1 DNA recombination protein RmuC [Bacillota bacterium]MCM1510374.1 DNA recombination protein RmuC [Clostridium sp.]
MEILYITIGIAIGFVIGMLLMKSRTSNNRARISTLEDELARLMQSSEARLCEQKILYEKQMEQQLSLLKEQMETASHNLLKERTEQLTAQNKRIEEDNRRLKQESAERIAEQKAMYEKQMEQQITLIKEQINTASEKILKERSEQLSMHNKEQLSAILNPLKDGIIQMREVVERSGKEHAETMVRLDATIKTSIQQSREVGERADKLAEALTGKNKTQGNFGELRLKQLLEDMGLEEGTQFEEQATMKDAAGRTVYSDEDGRRMVPDVILHFPDARDVIIDSKMSLKAFEDYHNAETEEERRDALARHIASVRQHVTELSQKNYSSYIREGRGKLDFVLMYVFSESALQLALGNDPSIWKEAYDKGVIIAGSQNLYMMLRVLEMTWRQVRQVENQENMVKAANTVVARVQMFYERFIKVEEQFERTRKALDDVKNVTASSGQSIEIAARKLIKYGAQSSAKRKYQLKASDTSLPEQEDEE